MNRKKSIRTSKAKAFISAGIGVVVIAALITGFFLYKKSQAKTESKTIYQYETVKKGSLTSTVSATGNVAVRDEVDVTPSTSGTVKKVYVSAGDTVSKGDTLFTLSSDSVSSQIDQAYSSVLSAKQQVAQAQSSLTSAKAQLTAAKKAASTKTSATTSSSTGAQSSGSGVTSVSAAKQAVSAAELGVSAAKSQLSSAQSSYSDALSAQDDLTVTAPYSGIVWSVNVAKGDTVAGSSGTSSSSSSSSGTAGGTSSQGGQSSTTGSTSSASTAAMTIAKGGKLGVKVSVNESDINSIKVGQSATVTLDAVTGKTFTGTVDEVSSEGTVSSSVVSYSVWITLDSTTSAVKSGMTASVEITTSKTDNVLLVSNAAVKGTGSNKYVLVMKSGATTPSQVKVTTGTRGSSQTVITSGLTEGQKIVSQAITTDSSGNATSVLGNMMSGGSQRGMNSGSMPAGGPSGGTPPSGAPGGN